MSTFIRYCYACCFLIISLPLQSQDIHLSHIHASPTVLNPAMNGLFTGDIRFIGNAKSQWNSVTNGYNTFVASADKKLFELGNADLVGGGIQIASDKAGDLNFKTTSVALGLSVLKSLDGRGTNYVAFGIRNAYITNSVDYSKIVAFDDESAILSGADSRIHYWDVSAGLAWFYTINRFNSFYIGSSFYHINKPKVSFFDDNNLSESQRLYRKWVFHGGADFRINRKLYAKPTFLFKDQGPHREITLGSFIKYKTLKSYRSKAPSSVYFGAWVRWHAEKDLLGVDAIIASIRVDYNNTYFTFTFDVNISSLTKVSYGRGGPEFSVVHILETKRSRKPTKVRCPDF